MAMRWSICLLVVAMASLSSTSDILMVTLGGTKSHKIPFWELARGLIAKNHSVTFISAFPADFHLQGLEEITPAGLVFYVRNYTNWDLVGSKMRGEEPVSMEKVVDFGYKPCDLMYEDHETKEFLDSDRHFDLMILDGAYPQCAFGMVHRFKTPFMYINTVGFYSDTISQSGSPAPFSVTPFFGKAWTDDMNLFQRTLNVGFHLFLQGLHYYLVNSLLMPVMEKHFGPTIPHVYETSKNVSFILQNGHHSVSYPRPYLPNVAEIACIHCKAAKPLKREFEDFINQGGDAGFIFVSMGSSVKAANMPEELRKLFVKTFARLPYQVLWKWESDLRDMTDLPSNVLISRWFPQQDLLGHKKIRAFVTHGGLLSMFETVYHGVPVVTMPVFCDHEANAAKAEVDGYAIKLDLQGLTSEALFNAIHLTIHNPKYKEDVLRRQSLLKDQRHTPLETAVYWVEYVIRHKGAHHLYSPARDLNVFQYYSLDTLSILAIALFFFLSFLFWLLKSLCRLFLDYVMASRKVKGD